ncbi:MAG: hypothetical protein GX581_06955 [Syntrophomonadaceae bacterium]|nr:hypothetical protein [Syntrophomonadaceae bacterium]
MLAVFGSGEPQSLATNLIYIVAIILAVYIFIKFCSWAKGFQMSGSVKKAIFILTGVALVGLNVLYAVGNAGVRAGNWNGAFIALAVAIAWVFVFAFALMSENKPE